MEIQQIDIDQGFLGKIDENVLGILMSKIMSIRNAMIMSAMKYRQPEEIAYRDGGVDVLNRIIEKIKGVVTQKAVRSREKIKTDK